MLVYHRLSDIVFRLGVGATVLARVPVVLPPLLGPDAAALLPLQRHLLGVNGFPVREGVKTLPPPGGRLIHASPNDDRRVVAASRNIVSPLATLQGLQRVLVTTIQIKIQNTSTKDKVRGNEFRSNT